jgi:hypothetical protein
MEEFASNKLNTPEIGNIYYIKRLDGSLCKEYFYYYTKKLIS